MPSCHLTPWRNLKTSSVLSLFEVFGGQIGPDRLQTDLGDMLVKEDEIVEHPHLIGISAKYFAHGGGHHRRRDADDGGVQRLVLFDQHVPQVSLESIRSDLATEWAWNEDGTELIFKLRQGVKWHDGKPFTSADVKCTDDLLIETASEKLRVNPRKSSFENVDRVTVERRFRGDLSSETAAAGISDAARRWLFDDYPCHVSPQTMRTHPIGTGPFKFVEFKPNEVIRVTRNPDYWKPDRPYLDGVDTRSSATHRRPPWPLFPGSST